MRYLLAALSGFCYIWGMTFEERIEYIESVFGIKFEGEPAAAMPGGKSDTYFVLRGEYEIYRHAGYHRANRTISVVVPGKHRATDDFFSCGTMNNRYVPGTLSISIDEVDVTELPDDEFMVAVKAAHDFYMWRLRFIETVKAAGYELNGMRYPKKATHRPNK